MTFEIWERKYELDSVVSFLKLVSGFYENSNQKATPNSNWIEGLLREKKHNHKSKISQPKKETLTNPNSPILIQIKIAKSKKKKIMWVQQLEVY